MSKLRLTTMMILICCGTAPAFDQLVDPLDERGLQDLMGQYMRASSQGGTSTQPGFFRGWAEKFSAALGPEPVASPISLRICDELGALWSAIGEKELARQRHEQTIALAMALDDPQTVLRGMSSRIHDHPIDDFAGKARLSDKSLGLCRRLLTIAAEKKPSLCSALQRELQQILIDDGEMRFNHVRNAHHQAKRSDPNAKLSETQRVWLTTAADRLQEAAEAGEEHPETAGPHPIQLRWWRCGLAAELLGDHPRAAHAFRRVLDGPPPESPHMAISRVLASEAFARCEHGRNTDLYFEYLEEVLFDPENADDSAIPGIGQRIAWAQCRAERWAEANRYFELMLTRATSPNGISQTRYSIAMNLISLGKKQQALEILREIARDYPTTPLGKEAQTYLDGQQGAR